MKRLILIDGNNWGFAGSSKSPLFSGEKQVQGISYVIERVREVIEENPEAHIMVLWDGRSWRHSIHDTYKGTRENTEQQRQAKETYLSQRPDIMEGLRLLGITQVCADNMEADDLAYSLTNSSISKKIPVTLLTADHDWQQLVQPGVAWINMIHGQSCRHASFKEDTGYKNPSQFIEAKCILGDVGDNIKGLMGVGPKALEGIYSLWTNFETFLQAMERERNVCGAYWQANLHKVMPKKLRELDVEAAKELLTKNKILMDLGTRSRPSIEGLKKTNDPLDREGFEEFCNRNGFRYIVRKLDQFLLPFEENSYVTR